ncbi:IS66 family insertion sequence element accessory protein TnpA [Sphingobacterium sp. G1-14]|nr:hypothetical protein [Sphingobacterium sp. G1-14]
MNNFQEKRERMLSLIADWQQSGKSKKAYCAVHNPEDMHPISGC